MPERRLSFSFHRVYRHRVHRQRVQLVDGYFGYDPTFRWYVTPLLLLFVFDKLPVAQSRYISKQNDYLWQKLFSVLVIHTLVYLYRIHLTNDAAYSVPAILFAFDLLGRAILLEISLLMSQRLSQNHI
ncbi:hypothetical protein U1Q18_052047, partial [Sarracenia purpurea var. burkii]